MTHCLRCGEKPRSDAEAGLIETHEMCRQCREADLRERVAFIHAEIRDLSADTEKALSHVLLDDHLEADVNTLAVLIKEVAHV